MEDQTLEELYDLAIKNYDYKRAVALKQQIREQEIEKEERKRLVEAIKVLDAFGITGDQLIEILSDLHKGEDE